MSDVTLTPDQKAFVEQCVQSGRYPDADAVVRAGLDLLSAQAQRRAAFTTMLEDAVAEGERLGWVDIDEMDAELDDIVRSAQAER
jgi:putative addiction module CopG family antidote